MKETLERLYFLNAILGSINYNYSSMPLALERSFVDLLKYHKVKVNLKHYSSSKTMEQKLEEEVC